MCVFFGEGWGGGGGVETGFLTSCQLPRVAQGVTVPDQRPPTSRLLTSYCLIGRFYIALFSALVQTHCAHVACASE